jgi:hypothetical protein
LSFLSLTSKVPSLISNDTRPRPISPICEEADMKARPIKTAIDAIKIEYENIEDRKTKWGTKKKGRETHSRFCVSTFD